MAIDIVCHDMQADTHKTYDVYFYADRIFTTVTDDSDVVADWINNIEYVHRHRLNSLIVGLDVEWRPSYSRQFRYPVATLQLCVGRRCLVFQLIHCGRIPALLADFLADPNYTFVGVGIKADLEKLATDYGIGGDAHAVDLGKLAASSYDNKDLKNAGLKKLARIVLEADDMEKPQRVTMSRWDVASLTAEQVQYACVDAFVSFEIGRVLDASN